MPKVVSSFLSDWVITSMKLARNFASAVVLTASIVISIASSPARASTPAPVFGTGENLINGDRDANWKIVAAPSDFTPPETGNYNSYVFTDQLNAITIGSIAYNAISVSPDGTTGIPNDGFSRNWILAQTFTAPQAGNYIFNFLASADNSLDLYVGGSISTAVPLLPTITGGIPIGTAPDFFTNYAISATVNLPQGANTLYAVLNDFGPPTSFILANNNTNGPTNDVPAPLPLFGAAAALGASRRLKRRIRLARTVAPDTAD
jgi:hypothetical protein